MRKNNVNFFCILISILFGIKSVANSITETQFSFGNSIDTRLEVNANNIQDITEADTEVLKKFINLSLSNQVGVIACSKENLEIITNKLKELDENFDFEIRSYLDNPWILNKKAAENLPKLTDNLRLGVQTILILEIAPDDIRVVFIKDNKNYAMNIGGMVENNDAGVSQKDTILNASIRELNEEIRLSEVSKNNLISVGETNFTVRKSLLKNLEWKEQVSINTYNLDAAATTNWLQQNNFDIRDELVSSYPVTNNEVEWVFIVKSETFKSRDIILSIGNSKTVKVGANHADAAAVVLKGKYAKNVLIGRGVNYINGKIKFGNAKVEFVKVPK